MGKSGVIKRGERIDDGPPHQHRRMGDGAVKDHFSPNFSNGFGKEMFPFPGDSVGRVRSVETNAGSQDIDVGVLIEKFKLESKSRGSRKVIRIHPRDVFGLTKSQSMVKRSNEPQIRRQFVQVNSRVIKTAYGFTGSVGRSVVDNDEFPTRKVLIEDALDRLGDERLGIVDGHKNTDSCGRG